MKFFARIVFICNICFVIAAIMRWYHNAHKKDGNFNGAIQIQPLESTLVVLGYGAIYMNFLFNLFLLALFVTKTKHTVPKWLMWTNFLFLLFQLYYFLFSNF